ncbi:hypothetical protein GOP47_0007249 [Adiantum capillus-veneris]|uniref:Uncharacterized protein n=1 Tax=Adiantum capillus-veneris TaxID=13818 RepID=A0A9D4ZLQ6_ADICA|nr:hypothetical protein GOP47_0007249 [Adiantum capillus-veneris]
MRRMIARDDSHLHVDKVGLLNYFETCCCERTMALAGTLIGWMLSALVVMLMPCAYTLSRLLRWATRILQGPLVARGRVVLITGASSGIGRHMAFEYARRGAKLVLAARREHLLREVADLCTSFGAQGVSIVPTDVSKEEDCRRMVNSAISTFGGLDVLVNNAGTTHSSLFEEYTESSEFRYVMDVDFWGNVYPTLHALEHLKRSRGHIVVTASVAAYVPYPYLTMYTAAKGAIVNFYDTLRVESLLKNDIGITLALPGFVDTEMTQKEPPVSLIPSFEPV